MFLPWGNEIWQDSKCYVIPPLVLKGVSWTFNPFYFLVTQLLGVFYDRTRTVTPVQDGNLSNHQLSGSAFVPVTQLQVFLGSAARSPDVGDTSILC